ncbi:MAG: ATP phosphoribosyltransferase regulatory subunit [Pseudomonadota bacterium]
MIAAIESVFERLGGTVEDPPIVMPAALPLELSGEAVRSRLCIFTDNQNRDVALRPDLTLPLAVKEVAARKSGRSGQHASRYSARAFRLPVSPEDPYEFVQVGCELYGGISGPDTDAAIYGAVVDASMAGGAKMGLTRFGDLAIFDAFVGALGLPRSVEQALRRAFREDGGISAIIGNSRRETNPLLSRLKDVPRSDAEALVSEMIDMAGVELIGQRSLDEIVTRLLEQASDGSVDKIPDDAQRILTKLVEVDATYDIAIDTLSALAKTAGLNGVDDVLNVLAVRFDRIQETVTGRVDGARFSVTFGRRFTYYDGFVFEIADHEDSPERPFGAGGRYDQLLSKLSNGSVDEPAIGGVVRPDRLSSDMRAS